MTSISWSGKIYKGGANTGWITIPLNLRKYVKLEHWYNVQINTKNKITLNTTLCLKKLKSSWGFYIKKRICEINQLIGQNVTVIISPSEFFQRKISAYKSIRLPKSIVKIKGIKKFDIYEVEVEVYSRTYREIVLISVIDRSTRTSADEYYFTLRLTDVHKAKEAKVRLLRKIEKIDAYEKKNSKKEIFLPNLFPEAIIGKIDDRQMIIFDGNHTPIITPIIINIGEFIHYFGCYHADGTKSSFGWSINASTPEQAHYYILTYKKIVLNPKLSFELSYSKKPSNVENHLITTDILIKYWKKNASIQLKTDKIRIKEARSEKIKKWNPYGSIRIRDFRSIVLKLHLRIHNKILDHLKNEMKLQQLWLFLFGVLEGDGYVAGGKNRFGIGFATNIDDNIISEFLNKLKIKYTIDDSRIKKGLGKGLQIRIYLNQVLKNLPVISENIFKYYPKRRMMFIKRLINKPSVKKLLESNTLLENKNTKKESIVCLLKLKKELEKIK